MTILIKQARITDPSSRLNGQILDLFIENGIIKEISAELDQPADHIIDMPGIHISPGWVDVFANFADPGFEYKETLISGAAAAAAGGYTDVMIIPNTNPVIQNKSGVEYIRQRNARLPVSIHPIGAITRNAEGKELAEMYDMRSSGAAAFSDGLNTVQAAGILLKALQYVKAFDGTIIQVPDDRTINPHGLINEGIISTQLGLPGKPAMAEELIVARDIKLARYTDSKLHLTGISTSKSVEYIRRGKAGGIKVSCSVTPYHLYFCDEDLLNYDTTLKVNPPIRTKADRQALREAVMDGTIDCIATHHLPHEYDSKVLEFENAKDGMTGLETAYAVLNTILPVMNPEQCVHLLSVNPRRLFDLGSATIEAGKPAMITLFDPYKKWTFRREHTRSRSTNSPFYDLELTGWAAGIINRDILTLS